MKVKLAGAGLMACAGLWLALGSTDAQSGRALHADRWTSAGAPRVATPASLELDAEPVVSAPVRPVATGPSPTVDAAAEAGPRELFGKVVDEDGEPVTGATVYLIPGIVNDDGDVRCGPLRARIESDSRGAFRFSEEDWRSEAAEDPSALDLGVVANGFRRSVLRDVSSARSGEEVVVVLERGARLSGRVVDERGQPVSGLELLGYTGSGGIDHVSPSQRLLRAERRVLGGVSSAYGQCLATTDGRGEVRFTGLPAGGLRVLSLDPGWTIEDSRRVGPDSPFVEWIVRQRLGVRLSVVERGTGQLVERAAATFCFELTFADGEVRDFEQWVGRGAGEVSFVLDPEALLGMGDRKIRRVVFYGTARSGEGEDVSWIADAIEDPDGAVAVGVVQVEVQVEADTGVTPAVDEPLGGEALEPARLVLDVRYKDATPFEGELEVSWMPSGARRGEDRDRAERVGVGRYCVEVPAAELSLAVKDRYSYGSLPPWTGEVTCTPNREATVFVTLQRGAEATVTRPEGWGGEWFVEASWRDPGDGPWQGGLVVSTDEARLTLSVLRPAEWRFELRRNSAFERDPLVRTVLLGEGDSVIVDR